MMTALLRIYLESLYWIEQNHLSWGLLIYFEKFPGIAVKKTAMQNVQAILRRLCAEIDICMLLEALAGESPRPLTERLENATQTLCYFAKKISKSLAEESWVCGTYKAHSQQEIFRSRRHFMKGTVAWDFPPLAFFFSQLHLGSCCIYYIFFELCLNLLSYSDLKFILRYGPLRGTNFYVQIPGI